MAAARLFDSFGWSGSQDRELTMQLATRPTNSVPMKDV